METLSSDILVNVLFPLLSASSLAALQFASKKYHRLVLSFLPRSPRNHFKILADVSSTGNITLLKWFIGRGPSDLKWSLTDVPHKKCGISGILNYGNFYIHRILRFLFSN